MVERAFTAEMTGARVSQLTSQEVHERRRNGWLDMGGSVHARKAAACGNFINAMTKEMDQLVASEEWQQWFSATGSRQLLLYLYFDSDPPTMKIRPSLRQIVDTLELSRLYPRETWLELKESPGLARGELMSMLEEVRRKRELDPLPAGDLEVSLPHHGTTAGKGRYTRTAGPARRSR